MPVTRKAIAPNQNSKQIENSQPTLSTLITQQQFQSVYSMLLNQQKQARKNSNRNTSANQLPSQFNKSAKTILVNNSHQHILKKEIKFKEDEGKKNFNQTISSFAGKSTANSSNPFNSHDLQRKLLARRSIIKPRNKKKSRTLDGAQIVREAAIYFERNPCYVKEEEVGETSKLNLKKCLDKNGVKRIPNFGYPNMDFNQEQLNEKLSFSQFLIGQIKQDSDTEEDFVMGTKTSKLPFTEILHSKRKQDRIQNHVMKCFTFGKKVRRQLDEKSEHVSRVDVLKSKFQRLQLLRQFFSLKKKNSLRKFKYPINEAGIQFTGSAMEIYDELQYCQESDIEDNKKHQKKKKAIASPDNLRSIVREQHKSLDVTDEKSRRVSRLDKKLIQALSLSKYKQSPGYNNDDGTSDTDTFHNLDEECENSMHSSPRFRKEQEFQGYDRLMPFDFLTHRKAKQFFKEDIVDIDILLQDKQRALQQQKKLIAYEDEAEQLREVPELTERLKAMLKVVPRKGRNQNKKKKLVIKGQYSSSSDDQQKYQSDFNYAQKVQNTQIRDTHNELISMFFQRTQAKNPSFKREVLDQLVKFKQSITPDQKRLLSDRQFVIVDMASLDNTKKLDSLTKNSQPPGEKRAMPSFSKQKADLQDYLEKQYQFKELAKKYILREKASIYNLKNYQDQLQSSSADLLSGNQQMLLDELFLQELSQKPGFTSSAALDFKISQLQQAMLTSQNQASPEQIVLPRIQEQRSVSPAPKSKIDPKTQRTDMASTQQSNSIQKTQRATGQNFQISHPYSTISSYTNFGIQSQSAMKNNQNSMLTKSALNFNKTQQIGDFIAQNSDQKSQLPGFSKSTLDLTQVNSKSSIQSNSPQKTYSQGFTLFTAKTALRESPYTLLTSQMTQHLLQNDKNQRGSIRQNQNEQQTKFRGYLAEKLRRKSVLNCDLFKINTSNQKNKVNSMLEQLDRVAGTNYLSQRGDSTLGQNIEISEESSSKDGDDE